MVRFPKQTANTGFCFHQFTRLLLTYCGPHADPVPVLYQFWWWWRHLLHKQGPAVAQSQGKQISGQPVSSVLAKAKLNHKPVMSIRGKIISLKGYHASCPFKIKYWVITKIITPNDYWGFIRLYWVIKKVKTIILLNNLSLCVFVLVSLQQWTNHSAGKEEHRETGCLGE